MSRIIGVDLGSTFSAVAYVNDNGIPQLIPNKDGDRLTPSVIFYDGGEFVVGEYAKQNALAEPEHTVAFIKREMGKPLTEFSRSFGGKQYSAESLSAEILKTLKKDAENELGEHVTEVVITVPAYFNEHERQATIQAGEIAGLNVQRIINEPTAAALAYGMRHTTEASTVLVFDLGGGTFDVTVMEIKGQEIVILGTNGDHRLGGKDWDDKIIAHTAKCFEDEHRENPLVSPSTYLDIQSRAVDAKIQLSSLNRATLITNYAGKSHRIELTRQKFEEMTNDLVERCRSLVDLVLHEITLTTDQIDKVLLAGGSTRLPMIQQMLTEHFGKRPDTSINPDEAVAFGAAVMGELIQSEQGNKSSVLDSASTPNIGITKISDVCSHSLGMVALNETGELFNSVIIPKNTNIPCEISKDDYLTTSDNQTEFDVIVLQGDAGITPRYCPVYDAYEIFDIPARPARETRIKVTYKYNANGVIEVEAADMNSEKVLPIRKKAAEIDWDALEIPEPIVTPMDIALVIDCSGSMSHSQKLDYAKKAAIQFLDDIDPSFQVGLITFKSQPRVRMPLTNDFEALGQKIESLSASGGNSDEGAIALARDRVLAKSENMKVLVLLADGRPADEVAMLKETRLAKEEGIQIITVGVGDDVDSDLLTVVASTPEDYYFVEESVQLESTFTALASRFVMESSRR